MSPRFYQFFIKKLLIEHLIRQAHEVTQKQSIQ